MIMDISEVPTHDSVCKASRSEKKRVFTVRLCFYFLGSTKSL